MNGRSNGRGLNYLLTLGSIVVILLITTWAQRTLDPYRLRVLSVGAIYVTLAVGLNLVYGFTGQFSLGHAGFMAVGAYTSALLTMPVAQKARNFFIVPIHPALENLQIPYLPALIIAGLMAALLGWIVGVPVLRLRGDYLGMATLGFSEVVRVLINNMQTITNGSMGLKGVPDYVNLYWAVGSAVVSVFIAARLVNTSYGRALKAIREDEIAAESVGVSLFYHKVLAFVAGAFFAGVGGALLGHWSSAVDPKMFTITITFQILTIVVIGGLGSLTGTVIASFAYAVAMEWLRFIEAPMKIGSIEIPGIVGMRMVLFGIVVLVVIVFYRQGLMGQREFAWDAFLRRKEAGTAAGAGKGV
ncbi:MAG: branched-chain amino acid ABC transporter permease [Firmicutes bacterium]|nr:branched-chain amino acid ABC transporter permease [Bacillota bacterium]